MPSKKQSKHTKDFIKEIANIEHHPNEEVPYNTGFQPRTRRAPVQLFEFLGPDMQESAEHSNNTNSNVTGNLGGSAPPTRILSRNDKDSIKQMIFKPTDEEFPTVGAMRTKKIKHHPTLVASDLNFAAGKAIGAAAKASAEAGATGAGAAVEVKGQAPRRVTFKPSDDDFPTVGSGPGKKIKKRVMFADDLKQLPAKDAEKTPAADNEKAAGTAGTAGAAAAKAAGETRPRAAAAGSEATAAGTSVAVVVPRSAQAATATATQSSHSQQNRTHIASKSFSQKKFSRPGLIERPPGNTTMPRQSANGGINAGFRRLPPGQLRVPFIGMTRAPPPMAMSRNTTSAPVIRSPQSMDVSRPPPQLSVNRSTASLPAILPPQSMDSSRPPPMNRPRLPMPLHRGTLSLPMTRPPAPQLYQGQGAAAQFGMRPRLPLRAPQVMGAPRGPPMGHVGPTGGRPNMRNVRNMNTTVPRHGQHNAKDKSIARLPYARPGADNCRGQRNESAALLHELRASNQPQFQGTQPVMQQQQQQQQQQQEQLKSTLNRNAVEFRPRAKSVIESMPEAMEEPKRRKSSITERRKRQRFYRTLKPHVMFEAGEVPVDLPNIDRSLYLPTGRPVILPLGQPNFPNMHLTAAAAQRVALDRGLSMRNLANSRRTNLPRGEA